MGNRFQWLQKLAILFRILGKAIVGFSRDSGPHQSGPGIHLADVGRAALRPPKRVVKVANMKPLSKRRLEFLIADLGKTQDRHLSGTTGLELLQAATFLDPRFKQHAVFSRAKRAEVRGNVKALTLQRAADSPLLEQALANQQQIPHRLLAVGAADGAGGRARGGFRV